MTEQYQGEQTHHLTDVAPHIYIRTSLADGKVLIERIDRHKGTAHTENLQQRHTGYPFLMNRNQDEFA